MTYAKHAAIKLALLLAVHFSVEAALAKTESFRKLPSYKDFDGFGPDVLPPDNFPVDWMEPDYEATDWTTGTTGDETVFTRSWKHDYQVVTHTLWDSESGSNGKFDLDFDKSAFDVHTQHNATIYCTTPQGATRSDCQFRLVSPWVDLKVLTKPGVTLANVDIEVLG